MTSNRFVNTLEQLIINNPIESKRWIKHCHDKIKTNDTSRCLDLFENFIQEGEIKDIVDTFDHIIRFMERFKVLDGDSYYIRQQIDGALTQLIHLACNNLFDNSGQLKARIVTLLELKPIQHQIKNESMIPAYLSAAIPLIHQNMMQQNLKPEIFGHIIIQVNQKLQTNKIHQKIYQNRYHKSLLSQLRENQIGLTIGLSALGTLFYYGAKYYSEPSEPEQNTAKRLSE